MVSVRLSDLARPAGLEPAPPGLEGALSAQVITYGYSGANQTVANLANLGRIPWAAEAYGARPDNRSFDD